MRVRYVSEAVALTLVPHQSVAVVSITEPGRTADLPSGYGAVLRVQFADAEYDEGTISRLWARGRPFDANAKGFPSKRTSEAIRGFLESIWAKEECFAELIVHCHAGQRRSAAVAKFASEQFGAQFDHGYTGYNKTVYALLVDPMRFDVPNKSTLPQALQRLFKRIRF